MLEKESILLQFNSISWEACLLGEQVVLLSCDVGIPIEKIHQSVQIIENTLEGDLYDIVPTYHSIAVFSNLALSNLISRLEGKSMTLSINKKAKKTLEIPICYEFGTDLDRVANENQLTKNEVIDFHLQGTYRALFFGFTPGFIYADGLSEKLYCPRLETPRNRVGEGSVGIAGNQTGIYSLASPGGWNIIGRTPVKLLDIEQQHSNFIDVGATYRFFQISKSAFDSWDN
ncbi:allophanate hydrolase subunit 1 [Ekhidna sp.]|uniref:5-oxoprolinase subunit B family protein n=1 Tax=Ekhidna sp. TaxID=2608089 RepID=UPI003298079A